MTRLQSVSVIVPTKNEAANIERFLSSIPDAPEVILCDASDDGTGDIALRTRPERTLVLTVEGTIAQARQIGAEHARGSILLFTDADVSFGQRYFARLLATSSWDAVYGAKLSSGRDFFLHYHIVAIAQRIAHAVLGISGASGSNMAIKKRVFEELGGFKIDLPCNEDSELFFRAHRNGVAVRFNPSLVVFATDHRRLRRGRLRKSLHSLFRNFLIYLTCLRPRTPALLQNDWGYWAEHGTRTS
jgi:glycosyltransferase involved in cell wall biosynthesis